MAASIHPSPTPVSADDVASRHLRAEGLLAEAETNADRRAAGHLRQAAVLLTLDLPDRVARRYRDRGLEHDDLVQVGRMALVKAANGYRVGRGSGFAAYAMPTILGEVKRHFRDTGWTVRPPRRLQEVRVDALRAEDRLVQDLHRQPTSTELASCLGIDVEEARSASLSGAAYTASSLDVPASDGRAVDVVADESADIDRMLRRQVVSREVNRLTERERLIVHLRFVEEQTQSEIAAVLGVSQMQVSRLLGGILARLRHDLVDVVPAA